MKKTIFVILVSAICFTTSKVPAQNFKPIGKVYNVEFKRFLVNAFALKQTGPEMDSTMRKALNDEISNQLTKAYYKWAKCVIKKRGRKHFELKLKGTKGFEVESEEYLAQFKKMQTEFISKRLTWKEEEVQNFLTEERLKPYIDAVMKKFESTTKAKFQALKP